MTWYAVDGMDGSGKTTSSDFIREQLISEGRRVLEITHPNTDTEYGRKAAKYLCKDGKLAVIMAGWYYIRDVLHSLKVKKKHQDEYDDVIFVRYSLAAAYLPSFLCKIGYRFIELVLPVPDVKIYVDVDPDTALERILARGEDLETFETSEKLRKTRSKMHGITGSWRVVDNSGTLENTLEQTRAILAEVERD
ncbi:MAG: thymidylate kinase [Thermoplasmata archaeon]|jgi:dTMP kinase|nr:thymidylate kinase [Thermoplasmata archaeon]